MIITDSPLEQWRKAREAYCKANPWVIVWPYNGGIHYFRMTTKEAAQRFLKEVDREGLEIVYSEVNLKEEEVR